MEEHEDVIAPHAPCFESHPLCPYKPLPFNCDGVYPKLWDPVVIGVIGFFLLDVRIGPGEINVRPHAPLYMGVVGLDELLRRVLPGIP